MGFVLNNARRVRGYLAKHDVECPGCRYQLRGIRSTKCPECGRELVIDDLLPPKPFRAQWQIFRIGVYVLGVVLLITTVWFLYQMRSSPKLTRGITIPFSIAVGIYLLLDAARHAYEEQTWPKFTRKIAIGTVAIVAGIGGLVIVCMILLNWLYP